MESHMISVHCLVPRVLQMLLDVRVFILNDNEQVVYIFQR